PVQRLGAEPVAAAARREVVQRPVEAVAAEEPFERAPRPDPVLAVVRDREGGQLGLDERERLERLLVASTGSVLALAPAQVAGQPQGLAGELALVAQPAEGPQPECDAVVRAG